MREGYLLPEDPVEQILDSVRAVFDSWTCPRAITYRNVEGIDDSLGTAATVQTMVFGNLGDTSGTGVAFSRDPRTGDRGLVGDFLVGAQGEDVVAGTHRTQELPSLADTWPDVWYRLLDAADTLEHHFADMVDIEFTVERGELYLLQCRRAKRSPAAVFRVALDMANDPGFPVDRTEAVRRCDALIDDPPTISVSAGTEEPIVLAEGIAASPGRASGLLVLDVDDAVTRSARGESVVLVRRETSPADVHGMAAAVGLVTTLGGLVSHAAVVARSWGLPAVVGVENMELEAGAISAAGHRVEVGDLLTVDGTSGLVLLGAHGSAETPMPEVAIIASWARTQADPMASDAALDDNSAGEGDCLRVISLKGAADSAAVAIALRAPASDVEPMLRDLTT
ncbi:MAG: PEP/pyruvate-binding domain-containing protein, partial [Acidimicrobiales bacterium]